MDKKILAQLEKLAYWLQRKYMKVKMTTELVGPHFAFFHPEDKSQKILSLHKIRLNRLSGKKIVLVTGCFDILHYEHLKFLKKAKKEGHVLVVGLESDKRVREMKGEGRPVNLWQKRAKNLVRLNEVDFVIKLPDDFNKQSVRFKIIRLIRPHILAISSQDPLEERKKKESLKIGCLLKVVHNYNPRVSTTKLTLDKRKKFF